MGGFFGFIYRQVTFKPKPLPSSVNLQDQTALVTGANVGLGLEAAKELASHRLKRLILGVRSIAKGEAAKKEIQQVNQNCNIEVWTLDHENFDSIISFADRASALDRLDMVVLNAGVKNLKYTASPTGHESNVQINHLGTSLLSMLLLPTLRRTAKATMRPSRLTIVSSEVHFWTPFNERKSSNILTRMDEKDSVKPGPERYNTSKLLNVLWTRQLATKVGSEEVVVNTVNPGFCHSSLHRNESGGAFRVIIKLLGWSGAQGGHCLTDALITQRNESHGGYVSEQTLKAPSAFVLSPDGHKAQLQLWSETLAIFRDEAQNARLESFST